MRKVESIILKRDELIIISRRGKVLTEREVFTQSTGKTYVRVTTNTYDQAERLVSSTVVENGKTAKIERQYGANGLLSREDFGNQLHRSYIYDIHGWLKSSNLSSLNSMVPANSNNYKHKRPD